MLSLKVCDYCIGEKSIIFKITEMLDKETHESWQERHKRYREELKRFEVPCITIESNEPINICEKHYKELGKGFNESH